MAPPQYRDDFKQDLFIIFLGRKESDIQDLYERGCLRYWAVWMVIRVATQERNFLHKNYIQPGRQKIEISERMDFADDEINECPEITPEMLAEVDRLYKVDSEYPFYSKIVQALQHVKSMRELSRNTGIPLSTISKSVKKVRTHLKNKLF